MRRIKARGYADSGLDWRSPEWGEMMDARVTAMRDEVYGADYSEGEYTHRVSRERWRSILKQAHDDCKCWLDAIAAGRCNPDNTMDWEDRWTETNT